MLQMLYLVICCVCSKVRSGVVLLLSIKVHIETDPRTRTGWTGLNKVGSVTSVHFRGIYSTKAEQI